MEVTGLGWSGTRTDRAEALAWFYEQVLGLRLIHTEPHFWVFQLPDGNHVEVFGQQYPGKEHFTTATEAARKINDPVLEAVALLRTSYVELYGTERRTEIVSPDALPAYVPEPDAEPTAIDEPCVITLSTTGKLAAMDWDEPGLALPYG